MIIIKKVLIVQPHPMTYYPLVSKKISAYHKANGDKVEMVQGRVFGRWDVCYITTLLSVNISQYISTIEFYKQFADRVEVGGPAATAMWQEIHKETGIMPHRGLVPEFEAIQMDHSIIGPEYGYSQAFASRGCPRSCKWCLVPIHEPKFIDKVDNLAEQIDLTRRDLMLMDNNLLFSRKLPEIVEELVTLGFGQSGKRNARRVDVNQGADARLFSMDNARLLRKLNILPLRFALDSIENCDAFKKAVENAIKVGFKEMSAYMLYNFFDPETGQGDKPSDLFTRLNLVKELNAKYNIRIYTFPMKFLPLTARDRKHRSPLWSSIQLRGFQLMKNVCRGVLPTGKASFEKVVGKSVGEFLLNLRRTDEQVYKKKPVSSNQMALNF
ncbi:hypothetical protein [Pelotomaculum propionicicum]|uniref:hypothetical protein n=1 Tax=Pelotomaculum propionicicum TaxID=258475 RepID=UPI003B9FA9D2